MQLEQKRKIDQHLVYFGYNLDSHSGRRPEFTKTEAFSNRVAAGDSPSQDRLLRHSGSAFCYAFNFTFAGQLHRRRMKEVDHVPDPSHMNSRYQ